MGPARSQPVRPVRPPGVPRRVRTSKSAGALPRFLLLALAILAADNASAKPEDAAKDAPIPSEPAKAPQPKGTHAEGVAGPCAERIRAIRPGSTDPDAFLSVAACLRKEDPERAALLFSPAASASDSSLEQLRVRLPASEPWYAAQLDRLRARRDLPRLQDMAWLASLRDPYGPETWREIADSYALAGDAFRSAWSLLRQAERDSTQSGLLQYQLEGQLRSQADQPPSVLLDSLTALFRHRKAATAEILETVCWSNRHYPGAFVNTMAWIELKRPAPEIMLERAARYHAAGYFDYADAILAAAGWKGFPNPWRSLGRALFLRVRFQLEDWKSIAAETAATPKGSLTEEEEYIAAAASLQLGKAQEALARLQGFEAAGESPWGYRAQLLKSRALLSLGRLPEAAAVLDALKRSPRRREGTGPILFWQGWLALQKGDAAAAESLLVLASAYTGDEESQRALEYRRYLLLDSGAARTDFLKGLPESPLPPGERLRSLDKVPAASPLWPHARIEKAQILAGQGRLDSARAVLEDASRNSRDRVMGLKAEAMAAFLQEKAPGGKAGALARYEDLLIEYQQGVIPEFSRGRIRALK